MDTVERISTWIQEQQDNGRTASDLDGTIFVLSNNKTARISEVDGQFDLEILLHPYTVDFTESKEGESK